MRTNIEIDDALMAEALERTGFKTKKQVMDEALRMLVRLKRQSDILNLRGKITWEGDLDDMRTSKYTSAEDGTVDLCCLSTRVSGSIFFT